MELEVQSTRNAGPWKAICSFHSLSALLCPRSKPGDSGDTQARQGVRTRVEPLSFESQSMKSVSFQLLLLCYLKSSIRCTGEFQLYGLISWQILVRKNVLESQDGHSDVCG